jgi:hypothetical protein
MGLVSSGLGEVLLLGSRHSAGTLRLREFLSRNAHPYVNIDVDDDAEVQTLLDRFHVAVDEIPVVIGSCGRVFRNPTIADIARYLGMNPAIDEAAIHDLVVVGAGPAGLAAAVYAASEGLDVLVVEASAFGGQAGSSSKIENYLGFPTGISGAALAGRAFVRRKNSAPASAWRSRRSACDARRPIRSICPMDARCSRAPWSLRPARSIASRKSKTCGNSRAPGSTTPPLTWKQSCARAKTSWSSAAATRPGRQRCFWPVVAATCTC